MDESVLRDSTIKYGVDLEQQLLLMTNSKKLYEGFNYSPYINEVLRTNKYVKFPPYPITVGIDSSETNGNRYHLKVNSGNRLYFPQGSKLVCPPDLKTNGYIVFIFHEINNVFIDGIRITGSKVNSNYINNPFGGGIALFACKNILITNATITDVSGDGLNIRTNWKSQCENIKINGLTIDNATRVGILINGIINGEFNNIKINNTGDKDPSKILKPQTALSFEPNDCTSKYINCVISKLETNNNLGPVLGTANFYHLFQNNVCGNNNLSIKIIDWRDVTEHPRCYGATIDLSTVDSDLMANKYDVKNISGKFEIINPILKRNTGKLSTDKYFISGRNEDLNSSIKYIIKNPVFIKQNVRFAFKDGSKNSYVNQYMKSNRKVLFRK